MQIDTGDGRALHIPDELTKHRLTAVPETAPPPEEAPVEAPPAEEPPPSPERPFREPLTPGQPCTRPGTSPGSYPVCVNRED